MLTNMDKLYESVAANGPVCVGLDTEISYLPPPTPPRRRGRTSVAFNRALINATKGVAGCYKVQIAYYESLAWTHARLRRNAEAGPRHRPARHCRHQARRHCQDRRNVRQGALYR